MPGPIRGAGPGAGGGGRGQGLSAHDSLGDILSTYTGQSTSEARADFQQQLAREQQQQPPSLPGSRALPALRTRNGRPTRPQQHAQTAAASSTPESALPPSLRVRIDDSAGASPAGSPSGPSSSLQTPASGARAALLGDASPSSLNSSTSSSAGNTPLLEYAPSPNGSPTFSRKMLPQHHQHGHWQPSPAATYTAPADPFADPRAQASASSRSSPTKNGERPGHLRQRSIPQNGADPLGVQGGGNGHGNPFADATRSRPGVAGPHAAMLEHSTASRQGAATDAFDAAKMRRQTAHEWLPITRQYLYNDEALNNDDATRVLRMSYHPDLAAAQRQQLANMANNDDDGASSSAHGSGEKAKYGPDGRSRYKYDLTAMTPEVLRSFAHARNVKEDDDALHDPGPVACARGKGADRRILENRQFKGGVNHVFTWRGLGNLGAVFLLLAGIVMLFGGYPVYIAYTQASLSNFGATGLGGTNSTGQVPDIAAYRGLIDSDTPESAMTWTNHEGVEYELVFSDEFEQAGRTFYPGDDPYWEAVDLHYWQTNNIEWYDPGNVITNDGHLEIWLTKETDEDSHGRGYLGGMLQSWNQFCFTGGYIEVAVSLPGDTETLGLWPAAWTMGNLGRAGFGGSLDGNWPYSYDVCDIGTLANQTDPATGGPDVVTTAGDPYNDDMLSYLPGQRLSRCTCDGETHPGPKHDDGTYVGRSAPEIDIFEAVVTEAEGGEISQSAQWAPYNPNYEYVNTSTDYVEFYDNAFETWPNSYMGGVYQQVTSGLSYTNSSTYNSTTNYEKYGFDYQPSYMDGWGTGWITWTQGDEAMWTLKDTAMGANSQSEVGNRDVTGEPLYIIFNLGMSENFGFVDLDNLDFPSIMRVDYVRVYQPKGKVNIGCSTERYPTAQYIKDMAESYVNPNITLMADMGLDFPKNRLIDNC